MWFTVVFYDHMQPIAAAIGCDGNVYFKATDVARLLGYANVYNFAYRYGVTDFNTKLLPSQMKRMDVTKKCIVFSFTEMLFIIKEKKHKLQTKLDVDDMIDLWINGSVDTIVPMHPSLDYRYSPVLCLGRDKKYKIQDWIWSYRLVLNDLLKKWNGYIDYEQPPSVQQQREEEEMVDDPPPNDQQEDPPNDQHEQHDMTQHDMTNEQHEMTNEQHEMTQHDNEQHEMTNEHDEQRNNNQDTIDAVDSNTMPLYNLNMNFEDFPPDQIFINIHNKSFKYVYTLT